MTGTDVELVDLHSHLVPGVDDGARTLEDSLDGLGRMMAVGVVEVVTTPHVMASLTRAPAEYEAWAERVDTQWSELSRAASASFPALRLGRGHEVMLDVPDPDLSDSRFRLGDTSYVLLEWPRLQVPPGTVPVLERLVREGVRPLIAHPERYGGIDRGLSLVAGWRNAGARLQCNFGSLLGRYGPAARSAVLGLLERGWVDCLSTDFHGRSHLKLYIREARELLQGAGAEEAWTILTAVNPRRILQDDDPIPVPLVEMPTTFWGRMRDLFKGA